MTTQPKDAYQTFLDSMEMNYEKWHDGIGYDLGALAALDEAGRQSVESMLLARNFADWRDVEALAALGTPRALAALRECARTRRDKIGLRAAQELGEEADLLDEDAVVEHIRNAEVGGLDALFDEVERSPTEAVKRALLELARSGPDVVRCHAAAELYFLAGKASERFDWEHRPFFLRFEEPNGPDREAAWRELAEAVGLPPTKV
jgi:hypothetical protein